MTVYQYPGIINLKINGKPWAFKGDFNVMSASGINRTTVVNGDGTIGFVNKAEATKIKGKVSAPKGFEPKELWLTTNYRVQADADNGQSWLLLDAFAEGTDETNYNEGAEFEITFVGTLQTAVR
jgi:hypothetical protein